LGFILSGTETALALVQWSEIGLAWVITLPAATAPGAIFFIALYYIFQWRDELPVHSSGSSCPYFRQIPTTYVPIAHVLNDRFKHTTFMSNSFGRGYCRMPWVKDFDVDEAVDRAKQVFWAKGYEATSIANLVDAMKINKGSLYNAFGSKKALFVRALLKYDRENRQATLRQLEAMDDPIRAIETLFDGFIDESLADAEHKGCLLVNTALELPNQSKDIQDLVVAAMADLEGFFKRMITLAQTRGEVSSDLDANQVAKSLLSQVVGLRVLSRGVADATSLNAIRTQALRQITS